VESLFLRKIFPGILPGKISKNHATSNAPSAAPLRLASLISTQQEVETSLRNDLQVISARLIKHFADSTGKFCSWLYETLVLFVMFISRFYLCF
jgi:hypothetical protein